MSANWSRDIHEMHEHFKMNEAVKKFDPERLKAFLEFRADFIQEEMRELRKAIDEKEADDVVDALIDICVVALGTLDGFGVDARKAWNAVHKANMKKEVGQNPN